MITNIRVYSFQVAEAEKSPAPSHPMWSFYSELLTTVNSDAGETSAADEVNSYLQEPLLSASSSVLSFWKTKQEFPRLRTLARKYLSIPAATVCSERLFSTAGLITDKKRNRLDPDRVKMLVFLKKNL